MGQRTLVDFMDKQNLARIRVKRMLDTFNKNWYGGLIDARTNTNQVANAGGAEPPPIPATEGGAAIQAPGANQGAEEGRYPGAEETLEGNQGGQIW